MKNYEEANPYIHTVVLNSSNDFLGTSSCWSRGYGRQT